MSSLTILANDFQKIDSGVKDFKGVRKETNKDFSRILEDKQIYENKLIKNPRDKDRIVKDEKVIGRDLDTEDNEIYHKIKDKLKDVNSIFETIYGLLLNLSLSTEELNEEDFKTLNTEIGQLSLILEELLKQDSPFFTSEDYKNMLEVFKGIEKSTLLMENKLGIDKEWAEESFEGFEDVLNGLKENFEAMKPIVNGETQYMDKNPIDLQYEESSITTEYGQSEKIDLDEMSDITEGLPKKDEPSIENLAESTDETNIEKMESNTSSNIPFLQMDSRNILKSNSEIQNNEFQEIDNKLVFEQIVEKAKLVLDDNKQEIRIKLKPEILGELILKMEVEKGGLLAKVLVDNYKTKELLETNLYQFKEEMKDNGLEIKAFEVFVGTNEDFERENRREFFFNKKPSKLKIKNSGFKEVQAYDKTPTGITKGAYHDGQLNLFA